MSDGYVFNPNNWVSDTVTGLDPVTVDQLDDRYVNIGENVFSSEIENLQARNINIGSGGRMYFADTSSIQTTAYIPADVDNKINSFLTKNNTFTGTTSIKDLNITDSNTGARKSKISSETVSGTNILSIENTESAGRINLITRSSPTTSATMSLDQFGNIAGLNDLTANKVITNSIAINSNDAFLRKETSTNNAELVNNQGNASIKLKTKTSTGTVNTLTYTSSGDLTGINNFQIAGNFVTPSIQLTGTNQTISASSGNFLIDNKVKGGSFKIRNYDSTLSTFKTFTIDSDLNIGPLKNINCESIKINTINHSLDWLGNYLIDNKYYGSMMKFINYTPAGVANTLIMDQDMNLSGVKNMSCNTLTINGSNFSLPEYQDVKNRTNMISTSSGTTQIINTNTNKGLLFFPTATVGAYNNLTQIGDHAIIASNSADNLTTPPVLTLACWSTQPACGIRITQTETQLTKAKVIDNITFPDGTTQAKGYSDTSINQMINNAISNALNGLIPVGSIFPYAGYYYDNSLNARAPPPGYLWCVGGIVSTATYSALYSVIGDKYKYGRTLAIGSFYLPDYRGCVLKGCGANTNFTNQTEVAFQGDYQQSNVGYHYHTYTDRATGSKNVSANSVGTTVANANSGSYSTSSQAYSTTGTAMDADTRVNSIGVNYIIKY